MRDYELDNWIIHCPTSIREIVEFINKTGHATVFVTDLDGALMASVTDGDVRRALLAGHSLESVASAAYNTTFVAVPEAEEASHIISSGWGRGLSEFPVLDNEGRVVAVDVHLQNQPHPIRDNLVVIMVGGKGLRLRPLTEKNPKPLLVVAGKPILQHIIENLRDEGFVNIALAINYLGEKIEAYFEDGSRFGVNIQYLREDRELGTAGALSLLRDRPMLPLIVMNGDLIMEARVATMLDYHMENHGVITLGAKIVETTIPFGVLSTSRSVVEALDEKPTYRNLVNAGVYVLDQEVLQSVRPDRALDMPDLVIEHLATKRVLAFPIHEMWSDLGRPADLQQATEYLRER